MNEKLKQVAKREIEKLPIENGEAINAVPWEKTSEEIGKKYLLNENELNTFQVQTLLILLGLEDPDYYIQNIENEVGTSKEKAKEISEEVFQKIFAPINDIFVENIKKSEKIKNPNLEQNLDFILSGGDYSALLKSVPEATLEKTADIKNKLVI